MMTFVHGIMNMRLTVSVWDRSKKLCTVLDQFMWSDVLTPLQNVRSMSLTAMAVVSDLFILFYFLSIQALQLLYFTQWLNYIHKGENCILVYNEL